MRFPKTRLRGPERPNRHTRWIALTAAVASMLGSVAFAHEGETHGAEKATAPEKSAIVAGTGIEGRVVREGEVLEGARVYAYTTFEDMNGFRPFAASGPTADDGTFRMDLPGGHRFHLVAKKRAAGAEDGPVGPGDYFSYHGSNPINVVPGTYTHVGFSMVLLGEGVTYEDGTDPDTGSLMGVVTYQGEPLAGVRVSLYMDGEDFFRGMGYSSAPPTGKTGRFRLDFLPEFNYFLIGRKRTSGAAAGPMTDGDHFGYYVLNPVPVKAGKVARVDFEVVSKAGEIGKEDSLFRKTGTTVTGRVTDAGGKPAPGAYAFAYLEKVMAHKRPEFISREVDAEGRYVLHLASGGTYYIGARSAYGDSPGMGEWYGKYDGSADHSVQLETGQHLEGIDIVVERILPQ